MCVSGVHVYIYTTLLKSSMIISYYHGSILRDDTLDPPHMRADWFSRHTRSYHQSTRILMFRNKQ